MAEKKVKLLMAKVGMDGHDRGMIMITNWLRDVGVEVVYLGSYQTIDKVVKSAIEEDVDVIGLSFLGGGHLFHARKTLEKMKENNVRAPLITGGIIPKEDIPKLKEMGVAGVYPAGSSMETIVEGLKEISKAK